MAMWTRAVVGAAIVAAGLATGLQPASALTAAGGPSRVAGTGPAQHASCSTTVEEQWIGVTSEYRVRASCDHIDPGTRVRGVLDTPWYPDAHTPWFTDVNRTYVSDWKISPIARPSSRMEYSQVG